jgi:transcriptional regulator GlxA family with amidase domain
MAVCFSNDAHSYNTNTSSKVITVIFSPEFIKGYLIRKRDKTLEEAFFRSSTLNQEVLLFINMLQQEYAGNKNEYVIKGYLYSIFGKLDSRFIFKSSYNVYDTTIQKLLKYIGERYSENITLEETAKSLGFSKYYLSRLFNNKIGYQFNDYVNRLRLNMAQSLLSETDMAVSNIALECGFESLRNFNRVFKQHMNYTPTEFRKQYKK